MIKYLKRVLLIVASVLGVYLIAVIVFSALSVPAKPHSCARPQPIYIQHSAVHTNLVFPTSSLSERFYEDIKLPVRSDFIMIGLGDRDVYINTPTWGDLKFSHAVKALFWPSKRVLNVQSYDGVGADWIELSLCPEQFAALEAYVLGSLSRRADGQSQIIEGVSHWGGDRFYEAEGYYSSFNSCNNWVNGAMKAAGLKTSIWSPTSQGIVYHTRRQN